MTCISLSLEVRAPDSGCSLLHYNRTILGTARGIDQDIACRLSLDGFTVVINDLPSQKSQLEEVQAYIIQ